MDVLVSFFLGVVIGVVAARVIKYLIALGIAVLAALTYFIKRGLIAFSWSGITSSIKTTLILNYHTYGIVLGVFWGIGIIVGVIAGRRKKKVKEAEIEISSRELYATTYPYGQGHFYLWFPLHFPSYILL